MIPYEIVVLSMFVPFFIVILTILILEDRRNKKYEKLKKDQIKKLYEELSKYEYPWS